MNLADSIDFQYLRDIHGWSQASLYINQRRYEFYMTHVLNDPLEAISMATVSLSKNANDAFFSWLDEPGQYDWQFIRNKTERSLLDVTISGYSNSNHRLGEDLTFIVPRDFWIDLVTLEIEKVAKLFTYSYYKENRYSHTFPWQQLKQLRRYNSSQ